MKRKAGPGKLLCLVLAICMCAGLSGACRIDAAENTALWGKELYIVPEEVPAAALQGENAQCCGVAPGGRLLIIADDRSYLYDTETGQQIPLKPGNRFSNPREGAGAAFSIQTPATITASGMRSRWTGRETKSCCCRGMGSAFPDLTA